MEQSSMTVAAFGPGDPGSNPGKFKLRILIIWQIRPGESAQLLASPLSGSEIQV